MAGTLAFDFGGRRVLVTGGTSGMGEATALAFAGAGARVVVSGRNQERGQDVVSRGNGLIRFLSADVSQRDACDNLVDEAVAQLGGLDILVNSAGVIYHATAEETTDEQWLETMAVNVNGVFYVSRAAIPHLRQSRGTMINIASDAALTGSYHLVAYCASKGAVHALTRAMACDHGPEGIRVNAICPGYVDTPMLQSFFSGEGRMSRRIRQ